MSVALALENVRNRKLELTVSGKWSLVFAERPEVDSRSTDAESCCHVVSNGTIRNGSRCEVLWNRLYGGVVFP